MTNNVLSLSIVTRGTHVDDLEKTLISVCDEVGDIDTSNIMTTDVIVLST
jgi:hypothetical protein